MDNNQRIAQEVLAAVGGAENIAGVVHCMTRLRFTLIDPAVPADDEVKAIDGVLTAQWSGGEYQVIVGQNVTKVYDALLASGAPASSEEASVPAANTARAAAGAAISYLSKTMVTLIPLIMGAAMFRAIAVVCGPNMLGIWSADSEIYTLFYSWIYNAGYYFLPIYIGWSAARQLGCSEQLGMLLGGVLIAPELMDLVRAAADGGAAATAIYGILPAALTDYSSTVLPMLLCMPVLAQVEKLAKKIVPDMLGVVFVPVLTLFVMIPVALCALAPLGNELGALVGNAMFALGNEGGIVGILALTVFAAVWEFFVMTGMVWVLLSLAIVQLLSTGSDSCVLVAATIAQFAAWGMAFGAFLRLKEKNDRGAMLGFTISGVIGGVTEPALYGCGFKYPRCFAGMVAGGAIGGLIAALTHVTAYTVGATNIVMIAGFAAGGPTNIFWCCVSNGAAFVAATAIAYLWGFTKEQLAADAAAALALKSAATGGRAPIAPAVPTPLAD